MAFTVLCTVVTRYCPSTVPVFSVTYILLDIKLKSILFGGFYHSPTIISSSLAEERR